MTNLLEDRDAANRAFALDITRSFLVQAPAGSGTQTSFGIPSAPGYVPK